jgi:flagellar biosynthesis/type III secretory pathway M-ring protein FliF/YscJ
LSKKTEESFDAIKEQVKVKKEKSKSNKKNTKDGNVNGNVNIDGKGDGNVNGGDNSNDKRNDVSKIDSNKETQNGSKTTINLSKEKKEPKKIKRTYYIYEDEDEKLNDLAEQTDRDKSELIRIAINFLYENATTD